MGDRGAGKRSLIQSINKNCVRAKNKFIDVEKMGSQFSAIDFGFLYVKDLSEKDAVSMAVNSEDNLPRMNVWMLQDSEKADLLKMVLKPENLEYTAAVIVLDFDQPWEMKDALNKWMSLLSDAILSAMKSLPISTQDLLKKRIAIHINNYERFASGNANSGEESQINTKGKVDERTSSKKRKTLDDS